MIENIIRNISDMFFLQSPETSFYQQIYFDIRYVKSKRIFECLQTTRVGSVVSFQNSFQYKHFYFAWNRQRKVSNESGWVRGIILFFISSYILGKPCS